ncbi:MAG TPA: DUF1194 domain-containing protein [Stellaceae bacterium]|nr:DUF1194 domain-containing protein [Stellaceae bacterium]
MRQTAKSAWRAAACAVAALLLQALPARAAALALVLAIDVSESVSTERYVLQHDGIARAFETPALIEKIAAAPGGIEVLLLEWSDPGKSAVTVGWTRIADRAASLAFAAAVRNTHRTSRGLTAIGPALLAAAATFNRAPEPADRRVIDISGDGMANIGVPPAEVRDRLVQSGITINGLAIVTEERWLEDYYRDNVIGGPASFVLVARNMDSFAEAMLRKLVEEIALAPERHGPFARHATTPATTRRGASTASPSRLRSSDFRPGQMQ